MKLNQLQKITLASQGLLGTAPFGKGKTAVLNAVQQLGYLQIDTLSVVERAHHHTLWTRIPDYKTTYLDDLVKEQKIFEYWFHAASYLPVEDYRFALPQMLAVRRNEAHHYNATPQVMQYIMDTIRAEGPKKARDFENESKKAGSWWNWKPAKIALERLFLQGDLMISARNGMEKTYDLTERVLPDHTDLTMPSPMEFAEYLVKTYLRAYGFTTLRQITHLKTGSIIRKNVSEVLHSMLEQGTIQKIELENFPTVFVQQDLMEKTIRANSSQIKILSPFDNLVIHRDRVQQFFGFDYRIECYIPKDKRQYGYFCLPVLFGDKFLGRVDCKAHRKERQLEIIQLHIENENCMPELWVAPLVDCLKHFAMFNACDTLKLDQVSPSKLTDPIKQALRKAGY